MDSMNNKLSNNAVLAHPGKQHNLQVALALQKAGMLRNYIGGFYYKPEAFPYTLMGWLPSNLQLRFWPLLKQRCVDGLDPQRVISIPYFELVSKTLGNLPLLLTLTEGRSTYWFANWASDLWVSRWLAHCTPRPAMFYGFWGASLRSIRTARRLGIVSVLDVPIIVNANEIVGAERRQLGLPVRYPLLDQRLRLEVEEADYILASSPAVADSIWALNVPTGQVLVVPYGVDTNHFVPPLQRPVGKTFRVLFVGTFGLRKGVHYLLEAWRQLALPNSELLIVGGAEDSLFVDKMRNLYKGVFVEYGNVPHSNVMEFFRQADVFVFPSLAEGSA
jgi:alpha-maltose-1-phosphate synthase